MAKGLQLKEIGEHFKEKLSKIKLCLFDVDGILTDGRVLWMGEEIGFNRQFHIRDGYGFKLLAGAGIEVGIITGGESLGVEKRFEQLGVKYVYMGKEDKRQAYQDVLEKTGLKDEEVLYMGDEFFDMPILAKVGFAATVPNASEEVREIVDYTTVTEAGYGCAREVIDILRHARGMTPPIEY
ncbi:MAG: phenylphosphate carboxylase subunit delta [Halobacteriovoraceae bacterium]|nr:phenylphosphate carboxylase subunit delta [Halobacteriovoraceae bacterium]